jgi:TonB-dependent receptor-like protein/carboxypeptidase family protein
VNRVALFVLLLPLFPSRGDSQTIYGEIQGTVTDRAGLPAAGAHVRLDGTAFRAIVDSGGRYVLHHLPAGAYRLSAELNAAALIGTGAVTVTPGAVARLDLVVQDPAASIVQSLSRDELGGETVVDPTLPVDDPRHALAYAPGVVLRRGDIGIDATPEISIRGGPVRQAAAYVDGAPVRNLTFGEQRVFLGANVIEQLSVVPGLPAVAFEDMRGGIINYLTQSGVGPVYSRGPRGTLRIETDEPFGNVMAVGYNRLEGSAGGPLRFAPHLHWFVAVGAQGQRSDYRGLGAAGQPTFVPNGVDTVVQGIAMPLFVQSSGACDGGSNFGFDCTGLRRPLDWSTIAHAFGRVSYSFGQGGSLSVTGIASGSQQRQFPGTAVVNSFLYTGSHSWSRLIALNWGQPIGAPGGGPLTATVNVSFGSDRSVSGPLDPLSEVVTRNPWLGIELTPLTLTGGEVIPNPITDQIVRNVRSNTGLRVAYLDRTDLDVAQFGRLNPFGMQRFWPTSGIRGVLGLSTERRVSGRGALEWRPGNTHRITMGLEVTHANAAFYAADLIRQVSMDAWVARPRTLGVYAGDRIGLGPLELDVGLRYDRFRAGAAFPVTPGRISSHPDWNATAATDDTAYANSVARTMVPGRGHASLSPRLRVGYALPPRTKFHAAIGQTAELAPLGAMLAGSNSDLSFTNVSDVFGRDVGYAKLWLAEFGLAHAIGSTLHADLTLYYKSELAPFRHRILPFVDPRSTTDTISMNVLTKSNGSTGTGIDARIAWSRQGVQGALTYSMLRDNPEGPFARSTTTHAITAVGKARAPGGVDAVLTARAVSGLPYTLLINDGNGTIAPFEDFGLGGRAAGDLNGERLPWTKTLDLRLSRDFRMGRFGGSVFADVRNPLGLHNTVAVFAETGAKTNDDFQSLLLSSEFTGLQNEAQLAGALLPDGTTIDLQGDCAGWAAQFNCVSLRRVEARFGNGDGIYTLTEQQRVLNVFYESFFGPWRFNAPGRTVRLGLTFAF